MLNAGYILRGNEWNKYACIFIRRMPRQLRKTHKACFFLFYSDNGMADMSACSAGNDRITGE
jgi:predicted phosphoadenosine phosphosulfate sulfurtransferase